MWVSLRWRELGWRDVGLARPANWPRAITIGVLCGIGMELLELFVIQPVLVKVFHKIPDFSELGDLQDNWNWLCSLSHWLRSWVPLVKRWSIAVI